MRSTTKVSELLALLVLAAGYSIGNPQAVVNGRALQQLSTSFTVEYIYRLEMNASGTDSSGDIGSVLEDIDALIVSCLQDSIPNAPVASEVTGPCFTDSDSCRWIKSMIDVSHMEGIPVNTIERATINLVQKSLKTYSETNEHAAATYIYPIVVSGWGRFEIKPVSSTSITDTEIQVLEKTFLDVFGAIVSALDGNTEVYETQFYDIVGNEISNQTASGNERTRTINTLSTDVQFYGKCWNCSNHAFVILVNDVIGSALDPFQIKLTANARVANSTYFERINSVSYSEIELPDGFPPVDDFSILDSRPPQTSQTPPWYLYFAGILAVVLIGVGVYLAWHRRRSLEKEVVSTDESDNDSGNGDEGYGRDDDVYANAVHDVTTPNMISVTPKIHETKDNIVEVQVC